MNRYSYVRNNPILYNDPTDHKDQIDDGGSCDLRCLKKQKGVCRPNDADCLDQRANGSQPAAPKISLPTYGNGLIGPAKPPHNVFSTSFQMFQVSDPYYYGQSAAESYNDFAGGGGDVAPGAGALPGLFNDFLLGYRPTYLKNYNPYDQNVSLLRIFKRTAENWIEIYEIPTDRFPTGDIVFSPDKEIPPVEAIFVAPDLGNYTQRYQLRIYVIGDMETDEGIKQVAAYVDLELQP